MNLRWLMLVAVLSVGCTQAPKIPIEIEQPLKTDTNFAKLSTILAGIPKTAEVVLYEGLPSDFWEPELLEQELQQKKTIRLHDYPFYEEVLSFQGVDSEQFTALLSANVSFKSYDGSKNCAGYRPDYCVEWKTDKGITQALICLECGEVKLFGSQSELHCDLSPDGGQKLKLLASRYQKNRPLPKPSK